MTTKNMKTIKELEAERGVAEAFMNTCKIAALKDVLGLIDEYTSKRLYRSKSCQLLLRQLKARIEGK